jgi:hypothetical protein
MPREVQTSLVIHKAHKAITWLLLARLRGIARNAFTAVLIQLLKRLRGVLR